MKIFLDHISNYGSNYDRNNIFNLEFNDICLVKGKDTDNVQRFIDIESLDNLREIVGHVTDCNVKFDDIIIWLNS